MADTRRVLLARRVRWKPRLDGTSCGIRPSACRRPCSSRSRTWRRARRSRSRSISRSSTRARLPLAVLLALVACTLVAISIGQLAKEMPSAGGLYSYVARALGPQSGAYVGWCYLVFLPLVAPLLFLLFAWMTRDVVVRDKLRLGC